MKIVFRGGCSIVIVVFILSCKPSHQGDQTFENFKSKFKRVKPPVVLDNLDSLYSFDDSVMVSVPNGWKYVKSPFPGIPLNQFFLLPPETDVKPGMRVNYQAVYSIDTKGDFLLFLFFKKIDADNEQEEGLGKYLVLTTFTNNGKLIDSMPFAFAVYNLSEQTGILDQNLSLDISRIDYDYDHQKVRSLRQLFEIDSRGIFCLTNSDTTFRSFE